LQKNQCKKDICAKKSPEDGQEKTETCSDEKYIEINILITNKCVCRRITYILNNSQMTLGCGTSQ
jgi:hypothetical protein